MLLLTLGKECSPGGVPSSFCDFQHQKLQFIKELFRRHLGSSGLIWREHISITYISKSANIIYVRKRRSNVTDNCITK